MKKEKIIQLKNLQSVCTYLEFLQGIINRMGTNSGNVKALISVVYTIFITALVAVSELVVYWWIGVVISFVGILLDSYYLALEKIYRKKYNNFIKELNKGNLNEKEIYNMNPKTTDLKYEVLAVMLETIISFSILGFYILFIIITILLKNI